MPSFLKHVLMRYTHFAVAKVQSLSRKWTKRLPRARMYVLLRHRCLLPIQRGVDRRIPSRKWYQGDEPSGFPTECVRDYHFQRCVHTFACYFARLNTLQGRVSVFSESFLRIRLRAVLRTSLNQLPNKPSMADSSRVHLCRIHRNASTTRVSSLICPFLRVLMSSQST